MDEKQKKLLKIFLNDLSDYYANSCCNDLTDEVSDLFTKEEWQQIDKEYHEWNGDPEEAGQTNMVDFALVYWLQKKLGLK